MLEFDSATTAILEDVYQGADFTRRRRASFDLLAPARGEVIIDIGSGPGHMLIDIARAVGSDGHAIGIDPSAPMRDTAQNLASGRGNVTVLDGSATELPLEDSSADKAVSVQVFEYLPDIPAALAECHRVLRTGGRLVIADMHFGSFHWASDDPARMARMIKAWDHHLVERAVPEKLPSLGHAAGFAVEQIVPVTFVDNHLRPGGLAWMMMTPMERYVIENKLVPRSNSAGLGSRTDQACRTGAVLFLDYPHRDGIET